MYPWWVRGYCYKTEIAQTWNKKLTLEVHREVMLFHRFFIFSSLKRNSSRDFSPQKRQTLKEHSLWFCRAVPWLLMRWVYYTFKLVYNLLKPSCRPRLTIKPKKSTLTHFNYFVCILVSVYESNFKYTSGNTCIEGLRQKVYTSTVSQYVCYCFCSSQWTTLPNFPLSLERWTDSDSLSTSGQTCCGVTKQ